MILSSTFFTPSTYTHLDLTLLLLSITLDRKIEHYPIKREDDPVAMFGKLRRNVERYDFGFILSIKYEQYPYHLPYVYIKQQQIFQQLCFGYPVTLYTFFDDGWFRLLKVYLFVRGGGSVWWTTLDDGLKSKAPVFLINFLSVLITCKWNILQVQNY